jgi:ATP-dependent DNA helicase RecG
MLDAEGLPRPAFEESGGHFRIIFKRPKEKVGGVSGGVSGGVNLLDYIEKNPGKRTSQMVNEINMAKRTIERQLKKLRDEGKIEFRGSAKKGGYFIKGKSGNGLQ